jgi:hypothetical protein
MQVHSNHEDLELTTSELLQSINAKSRTLQYGHQMKNLRQLLQQVDIALSGTDGLIPESDPEIVALKEKRAAIQDSLEEIQLIAPGDAFNYDSQPNQANHPDLPPVIVYSAASLMSGQTGRRGAAIAGVVMALLVFTTVVGCLRLGDTIRKGPYISNPTSLIGGTES